MAEIVLYGSPLSTYTRSARMALVEKGVDYELVAQQPGSDENRALHPFGKIPVLRRGDFTVFEAVAIMRYVDEALDGPALQPDDVEMRAVMTQWLSATLDYYYPTMVRGLVIPRLVHPQRGIEPDEAAIAAVIPEVDKQLLILSGALQDHLYLAGDTASLADLLMLPIMFYVNFTGEGRELIGKSPRLLRWLETMGQRASDKETLPPLGDS